MELEGKVAIVTGGTRGIEVDLDRGIETMNENRRLMREIYETRQANAPPLTGLEAMYVVVAGQMTDKQEHSAEMQRILDGLSDRASEPFHLCG